MASKRQKKKMRKMREKKRLQQKKLIAQEQKPSFEEARRKQDKIDRVQKAPQTQVSNVVYSNIIDMIDMYPTKSAGYLMNMLTSEINKYNLENVTKALEEMPDDSIAMAKDIIYYRLTDSEAMHRAIKEFAEMISGTIMDMQERKELGEVLDGTGYNIDNR